MPQQDSQPDSQPGSGLECQRPRRAAKKRDASLTGVNEQESTELVS
ncbi:MAG: hypothetical protein H6R22_37 [Chromatiaceae bacterium]|jgi:hypothetical protein|nr:hypothetical protein [Chromatiaceae bacterium]